MVAGSVATLAASPSVASAALTVTSATLDNVVSAQTAPGGVLRAKVNVSLTGGTDWHSTRTRIGSDTKCVNTGDHNNDGAASESFNVTAPGDPGNYAVGFTAFPTSNCGAPEAQRGC